MIYKKGHEPSLTCNDVVVSLNEHVYLSQWNVNRGNMELIFVKAEDVKTLGNLLLAHAKELEE